jgi:hypothetical protein
MGVVIILRAIDQRDSYAALEQLPAQEEERLTELSIRKVSSSAAFWPCPGVIQPFCVASLV